MPSERDPNVPSLPSRRTRRDWGQLVARIFCGLLALVGVLPLSLGLLLRAPAVSGWAVRETTRLLADLGIVASYRVDVSPWPLAVRVHDVRVESSDGGPPALEADTVSVQPRLFALLAGKLAIDQVEVDGPRVRVVLKDGKLENLNLDLPEQEEKKPDGKPLHAPFSGIAITDAHVSLDLEGTKIEASGLDFDVTVDDDPAAGSSFEVGLAIAKGKVERTRPTTPDGPLGPMVDVVEEDTLCGLESHARIEPKAVLVRRMALRGAVDLDGKPGTAPPCDLAESDPRRVALSLAHVRSTIPKNGDVPAVTGNVQVRAPFALAGRFLPLPPVEGYLDLSADARYAPGMRMPEVAGRLAVRGGQLAQYHIAEAVDAEVAIRGDVITSPQVTVRIGDGRVTVRDVEVRPFDKGVPIKSKVSIEDVDFVGLMRDLGVSAHAHVQWDLVHLEVPHFGGTLAPLRLDGELSGPTANFAVFDKARDDPQHARIVGVKSAHMDAHVSVRTDALDFSNVRLAFPNGIIEGGYCSIGFHEDLAVDVPKAKLDLKDIAPIGDVAMAGHTDLEVHVRGKMGDPKVEATGSIADYVLGDLPFGTVSHVDATFQGTLVTLRNLSAIKGKSAYEVPSARLDFGTQASLVVDAVATSKALDLRDFFSIFDMHEDPRFEGLEASMALRSQVHVALGGPEDVCGDGFFDIQAGVALSRVSLLGERFDEGSGNLTFRWIDRRAGLDGADIDVRSLVLRKRVLADGTRALGSVVGSAAVRRGSLGGDFVIEAIPLRSFQSLGELAKETDGSVSGFAQVRGSLDAFRVDSELDLTPLRVRGAALGASHVKFAMTQTPSPTKPTARTKCGGPIYPAFDKDAYAKDTGVHGEFLVEGSLFGGQVALRKVAMTRQAVPVVTADVDLKDLDLGAAVQALAGTEGEAPTLQGTVSGGLTVRELALGGDMSRAVARFSPTSLRLVQGGRSLELRAASGAAPVIELTKDALTVPPTTFDLRSGHALTASFTAEGKVTHVARGPIIDASVELAPVDLATLPDMTAAIDRASGRLEGGVRVKGPLKNLDVDGQLRLKAPELAIRGLPTALTDVDVELRATESELRVTRGSARVGTGTLAIGGHVPLRDLTLGGAEGQLVARDVRISGVEGVSAMVDANLTLSLAAARSSGVTLPQLSGDVLITSFEYTRPVSLVSDFASLGAQSLGVKSGRTKVTHESTAPDALGLDLRIRSRGPLRVRNNLLDLQIGIGSDSLIVTGTDKHPGLSGMLRTVQGGRVKFRATEFEIRQGIIRFEDPSRIQPIVDVTAVTEYRRFQDYGGARGAAGGGTRVGGSWRITLRAAGDADNLRITMESEPALSQEDILLLLTIGMTRAELDQLQAGSLGAGLAFEALANVSQADKAVKAAVPVIDDFRFGSGYSSRAGRMVPQVTLGKRLNEDVRATATTSVAEDRELRSYVEWRLGQRSSVLGSYDNVTNISGSGFGNVGADFRWRLEFE